MSMMEEVSADSAKNVPRGTQSPFSLRYTLRGHTDAIMQVAWSPDGHILASGSGDKTIRLWNAETGQELSTLEGHTRDIDCVSFSSDGRFLASKSLDGTVRIWRTSTWETVEIIEEASSQAVTFGLDFHPCAPILATLGEKILSFASGMWTLMRSRKLLQ